MSRSVFLYAVMTALGIAWGATIPLTKVAVSTGHNPIGLIAWQTIFVTLILTALIVIRGDRFPLSRQALVLYLIIALSGTLIPNTFSYRAAAELPAGIMAIIIALVPMFALPIALVLRLERLQVKRLAGLVLGALAVILIVGPEASLPDSGAVVFVAVALIAPLCYGVEGNYLAWKGTGGLGPLEVLWGASLVGALIAVPAAWTTGTWVDLMGAWTYTEWAILLISLAHAAAYVGYIWLVGAAGAVFAAQVAYLVTAAGVLWSMALLGERYAIWIWLAFALMMIGVALVQPRGETTPETEGA